jgi:hypothetical protein
VNESEVFAGALKLSDSAQCHAYLEAACAGDPPLLANVESLL